MEKLAIWCPKNEFPTLIQINELKSLYKNFVYLNDIDPKLYKMLLNPPAILHEWEGILYTFFQKLSPLAEHIYIVEPPVKPIFHYWLGIIMKCNHNKPFSNITIIYSIFGQENIQIKKHYRFIEMY